ncbi:methyltransferase [Candidatus Woesearchaeota archaeon]|jgi:HemK-related putative methylase|nr:methyltransferase [Candidatus Woesearchaeota archaeon]
MDIYEPSEDSFLLKKHVSKFALGRVLDMCTGSGIQAIEVSKHNLVREVVAVDINEKAIETLKEQKHKKITPKQGDLFTNLSGQFDLIICNPPYLPQDKGIDDLALYGGKHGWEFTERFFQEVSSYLTPKGKIIYLFSSLTNKEKVEEIFQQNLYDFKELDQQKLSFETLYVYQLEKNDLRRELEKQHLKEILYFNHGKRGNIYTAYLDKKDNVKSHFAKSELFKVAIKTERKESKAENRIQNEIKWLKILNRKSIGPKLIFARDNYFVYPFVEGEFILGWIKDHDRREIQNVLLKILKQCHVLDGLNVNKEELHRPHKHILVNENQHPVMIDFERCYSTDKPSNVTQFTEFLARIQAELVQKGFSFTADKLRSSAKQYKQHYQLEAFEELVRIIN